MNVKRCLVLGVVFWLGCGGTEADPATSSGGSTSQGSGGAGGAEGEGGAAGVGGGPPSVPPGTPLWTAAISTQYAGGSRFTVIGADIADDGRAYALSCGSCPDSAHHIGDLTVVDGQGVSTLVERSCSPNYVDDALRSCHLLAFDDDGTLASTYELLIRPMPKDAFSTPIVSVLSLASTPGGVALELRVETSTAFEVTSQAGTVVSHGETGRLHLELSHAGQELGLATYGAAPPTTSSELVSCAAYTATGQPQLEASFPLVGADRVPLTAFAADRCLSLGRVGGTGASLAGRPIATDPSQEVGFVGLLDASGQGPMLRITSDDDVSPVAVAGYPGGAAFAAKTWLSTEIRLGDLAVTFPKGAPSVIARLNPQGEVLYTTGFVAENGPPNIVAQPAITGLALAPDGRLAFCGQTNGRLREVSGGVVVDDFGDRVFRTPYIGAIDPADGRVAWLETPVTGDVVAVDFKASDAQLLYIGFIEPDGTAQVGSQTFTDDMVTLITSVAW